MISNTINASLQGLERQKQAVTKAAENIANYQVNRQETQETVVAEGFSSGGGALSPQALVSVQEAVQEYAPSQQEGEDFVSLEQNVLKLIEAKNLYEANASVLKVAQETEDEVLDILS